MGLSPWLEGGEQAPSPAALHLVMSPHYGDQQIISFLRRYQISLPGSIIWSKLDEALSFGTLVNVAVRSAFPFRLFPSAPNFRQAFFPRRKALSGVCCSNVNFPAPPPEEPCPPCRGSHMNNLPLVLSVTSGKGGVGKTNLSVNLSCRLAR